MENNGLSENRRKVMAELARMFLVFPIPGESHDVREARLQTYWDSIKDFPAWAVEMAVTKVRRGVFPQLNRSFAPTPAELAELIRLQSRPASEDNFIGHSMDGEIPMTWLLPVDPRWAEACRISRAADPKNRHYPMASKYAQGMGSWFRTEYVRGIPMTAAERALIARLYANMTATAEGSEADVR